MGNFRLVGPSVLLYCLLSIATNGEESSLRVEDTNEGTRRSPQEAASRRIPTGLPPAFVLKSDSNADFESGARSLGLKDGRAREIRLDFNHGGKIGSGGILNNVGHGGGRLQDALDFDFDLQGLRGNKYSKHRIRNGLRGLEEEEDVTPIVEDIDREDRSIDIDNVAVPEDVLLQLLAEARNKYIALSDQSAEIPAALVEETNTSPARGNAHFPDAAECQRKMRIISPEGKEVEAMVPCELAHLYERDAPPPRYRSGLAPELLRKPVLPIESGLLHGGILEAGLLEDLLNDEGIGSRIRRRKVGKAISGSSAGDFEQLLLSAASDQQLEALSHASSEELDKVLGLVGAAKEGRVSPSVLSEELHKLMIEGKAQRGVHAMPNSVEMWDEDEMQPPPPRRYREFDRESRLSEAEADNLLYLQREYAEKALNQGLDEGAAHRKAERIRFGGKGIPPYNYQSRCGADSTSQCGVMPDDDPGRLYEMLQRERLWRRRERGFHGMASPPTAMPSCDALQPDAFDELGGLPCAERYERGIFKRERGTFRDRERSGLLWRDHEGLFACREGEIFSRNKCRSIRPPLVECSDSRLRPLKHCTPDKLQKVCRRGFDLRGSLCVIIFGALQGCPRGSRLFRGRCAPAEGTDCPETYFHHDGHCLPSPHGRMLRLLPSWATCPEGFVPLEELPFYDENYSPADGLLCGRLVSAEMTCEGGYTLAEKQRLRDSDETGAMVCQRSFRDQPTDVECPKGFEFSAETGDCIKRSKKPMTKLCEKGILQGNRCLEILRDEPAAECPEGYERDEKDGRVACRPVGRKLTDDNTADTKNLIAPLAVCRHDGAEYIGKNICLRRNYGTPRLACKGEVNELGECVTVERHRAKLLCNGRPCERRATKPVEFICPEGTELVDDVSGLCLETAKLQKFGGRGRNLLDEEPPTRAAFCPEGSARLEIDGLVQCVISQPASVPSVCSPKHACGKNGGEGKPYCPVGYSMEGHTGLCIADD